MKTVDETNIDGAERPNIVLLVADDLGWNDVGYHGSQIRTPNIDALAASGAKLEQFYVMPSCTPTRASLLTGRYPMRYGLHVSVIKPKHRYGLPLSEKLLPQTLKEAGYQTAIVGKWHLGLHDAQYLPSNRGFDYQYGCYNGMIDYVRHTVNDELNWDTELIDPERLYEPTEDDVGHDWSRAEAPNYEKGYATDLIRDEAIRVIRQRDREKPLFLYVPFTAPHTPLQAKDLDLGQYEGMDMDTPRIFDDEDEEQHALRQKRRRFYAALVSNMDNAIGRIVETVRNEGMAKNTLIIFMSDNGGSYQGGNNDPLRGQKMLVYEGGVRVPAAVSYPGKIRPGTVVDQHLHAVDIYPTLATLAKAPQRGDFLSRSEPASARLRRGRQTATGQPANQVPSITRASVDQPNPLDGRDVWSQIAAGATDPERELLIHAREGRSSAIRVGDWKLVRNGKLGPIRKVSPDDEPVYELFNLRDDPCEKKNLAADLPEQVAALTARLDEYTEQAVPALYDLHPLAEEETPQVWGPKWWESEE